jgi:hypothetical protein
MHSGSGLCRQPLQRVQGPQKHWWRVHQEFLEGLDNDFSDDFSWRWSLWLLVKAVPLLTVVTPLHPTQGAQALPV